MWWCAKLFEVTEGSLYLTRVKITTLWEASREKETEENFKIGQWICMTFTSTVQQFTCVQFVKQLSLFFYNALRNGTLFSNVMKMVDFFLRQKCVLNSYYELSQDLLIILVHTECQRMLSMKFLSLDCF